MSAAELKLHSSGFTGADAGFGSSAGGFEAGGFGSVAGGFEAGGFGSVPGGFEAGGFGSVTGGVELEGACSSLDGASDGERIAKDPSAATWFAISDSRSLAIALPALAAMSDLIAAASGTLAPVMSEDAGGAAGLSPLQPLASISPASAMKR